MTTRPDPGRTVEADRLLETLERVLAIDELDLRGALSAACTRVAEALGADKVGVWAAEHGLYRSDQGQQVEDEPSVWGRWR